MTNSQSNIIFYSIISLIIAAFLIHNYNSDFFDTFTKSREELIIKKAMHNAEYTQALASYKIIVTENISRGDEYSAKTAALYEEMANLYSLLGFREKEVAYYLKSITIKQQLKKVNLYLFANTYYKLGSLAEDERDYDQAQIYFEQALSTRLGNVNQPIEEDDGMFLGMQKTRVKYLKLNHVDTIATYKKLGAIHRLKQQNAVAKGYYEKALAASKNTFGDDNVKTLEIMALMKDLQL